MNVEEKVNHSPVLEIKNVSKYFGGIQALSDVNIVAKRNEITAIIGPNGAGKTTLFNCITCIYTPSQGEIVLHTGNDSSVLLNGKKTYEVTRLGMSRTFQNIRLFSGMSVLENVLIARYSKTRSGILGAIFRPNWVKKEERDAIDRSYELLHYVGLADLYQEQSVNLSYGQQRRLEIARALASDPFILLLDEPAAGMNPQETIELKELILDIKKKFSLAILLIEHDMNMVMSISDMIYVMEYGCKIASGTPDVVRSDDKVIKAYLGEDNA